jgi:fumarate reductase subunit D
MGGIDMAKRSNEPIFWSLFGAGGVFTSMLTPVMILITGIAVPLGILAPETMSYERMHGFAEHWLGKLLLLAAISLPLFHAAHRIFHGLHDLGIHFGRDLFKFLSYGLATAGSVVAIIVLLGIGWG